MNGFPSEWKLPFAVETSVDLDKEPAPSKSIAFGSDAARRILIHLNTLAW